MNFNIFQVMDVMDVLAHRAQQDEQQRAQQRRLVLERRMVNPLTAISDAEFRTHFRFTKDQVGQLVQMLLPYLQHESDRGNPLTPVQQLCAVLNYYGGGHFQRITGLCGGISQRTAQRCIANVTAALCEVKADHIMMPTIEQMEATAQRMEDTYDLPRNQKQLIVIL
jgi:hypothetical protein